MSLQTCRTPLYVLRENGQLVGPDIAPDPSGNGHIAIYGFSGRVAFEAFVAGSQRDLRPYPLMKGYLKNRLDEQPEATQIMVLDVTGPAEASVEAVTMENVLAARIGGIEHLNCDLRLTYSATNRSYTLETQSP